MSNSLWPHGLYSPWNSPSQNTGVGSLSLLRGIFPTQGSNPGLPHCRQFLYQLSHTGSPKRGTVMIKSNPIPTRWVTHRLENNNTKEVLTLLWRFWIPHSVESQPGGFDKGTVNPQGVWPWGPAGYDYRPSRGLRKTETPILESANKILCAARPGGEDKWPHRRLNQNHLPVSDGRLWRHGLAGVHQRDEGTRRSPVV